MGPNIFTDKFGIFLVGYIDNIHINNYNENANITATRSIKVVNKK